jgi:hypothetical protein
MKDDTDLLQRCLDLLRNMPVKHPQQIEGKNAAIAALRKRLNLCPQCGAETRQNHDFVGNIETFWLTCSECDWVGEPE